ncbi:MAG: hypothetical protein JWL84_3158 [Rhodospirillales bacterium]|nr:hypothetical protein [Rhodospirillales bacterium]
MGDEESRRGKMDSDFRWNDVYPNAMNDISRDLPGALSPIDVIETGQRRALRRNKLLATGLLLAAAAVFAAATALRGMGFWMELVRAAAEAAIVGALADWFAVTAVFRHPLGLPIPHTAIVARNKDRIGEGLGAFVAGNFLTAPLLSAKLRETDLAGRLAQFLAEERNAAAAAERIIQLLPHLVRALEDPEIRDFAIRALGEQLRAADLSAGIGRALSAITVGAPFDALFDRLIDALQSALAENSAMLCSVVEERSAWWVPKTVDRRIASAIITGVVEFLDELRDRESLRRLAFRARLELLASDLVSSPSHRRKLDDLKNQLLEQPEIKGWMATLWDGMRGVVLDDLTQPQSRTREAICRGLLSLGRTLEADAAIRARLNAAVEEAMLAVVVPWRHEIGRFISEVVRGWETKTVVDRLELALGADLQYIRITGTLVGACVGCLLFLLSHFLG